MKLCFVTGGVKLGFTDRLRRKLSFKRRGTKRRFAEKPGYEAELRNQQERSWSFVTSKKLRFTSEYMAMAAEGKL